MVITRNFWGGGICKCLVVDEARRVGSASTEDSDIVGGETFLRKVSLDEEGACLRAREEGCTRGLQQANGTRGTDEIALGN